MAKCFHHYGSDGFTKHRSTTVDDYKFYEWGFSFIDHKTMYIVEENYTKCAY